MTGCLLHVSSFINVPLHEHFVTQASLYSTLIYSQALIFTPVFPSFCMDPCNVPRSHHLLSGWAVGEVCGCGHTEQSSSSLSFPFSQCAPLHLPRGEKQKRKEGSCLQLVGSEGLHTNRGDLTKLPAEQLMCWALRGLKIFLLALVSSRLWLGSLALLPSLVFSYQPAFQRSGVTIVIPSKQILISEVLQLLLGWCGGKVPHPSQGLGSKLAGLSQQKKALCTLGLALQRPGGNSQCSL